MSFLKQIYPCHNAAAAKSLQSCPTLCDPIEGSPPCSPIPWDSPGKNTGVGCHCLLQGMKVKSESEVTPSCLTVSNPMDYSLPGSSIHGIFQAKVLEWVAIAFFPCHNSCLQIFEGLCYVRGICSVKQNQDSRQENLAQI